MDRDDVDPRRALLDKLTEPVSPVDALAFLSDLVRRAEAAPEAAPEPGPPPPPSAPPPSAPPPGGKDAQPNRGNYLGDGLYDFQGGETKKLIVYVGPDVHRAVKAAAALRETTMSEVVDAVLRAAGFGDPDGPTAAQGRTQ